MIAAHWPRTSASAQTVPRLVNPPVLIASQDTVRTTLEYNPAQMKQVPAIFAGMDLTVRRIIYPIDETKRQSMITGPLMLIRSLVKAAIGRQTNAQAYGMTEKS